MEYQGIITGIGDKDLGKNLIQPEYDAVINDFIIGKNTILEGLGLNGKELGAGACVLCGYRGIIEENKTLDTVAYVYGEFTLNSIYGGSGEDSFNIVTSNQLLGGNVNPSQITSAGTYYLLLYVNGVKKVDNYKYPKNSQYSVETKNVLSGAVISETATTPTETKTITNELGEKETVIVTDLHLPTAQPKRVANTEYVHAQIEKEIDYYKQQGNIYNISNQKCGTYIFERKSKYVVGKVEYDLSVQSGGITAVLEEGLRPTEDVIFVTVINVQGNKFRSIIKIKTSGVFENVTTDTTLQAGYTSSAIGYKVL